MTLNDTDTILVRTSDTERSFGAKAINVEVLGRNINIFLAQVEVILNNAPDKVGKFGLKELTVSAEVSAKGALILVGTGVESEAKGSLTFKFERQ